MIRINRIVLLHGLRYREGRGGCIASSVHYLACNVNTWLPPVARYNSRGREDKPCREYLSTGIAK